MHDWARCTLGWIGPWSLLVVLGTGLVSGAEPQADACDGLADTARIKQDSIAAFRGGDYAEAERIEHCVLQRARAAGERKAEAQSINNLGVLAKRRGDADQALAHYEESLAIRRTLDDRAGMAQSLNNIAVLHKNWGNFYQALSLQLEALPLRSADAPHARAESLDNIALIYLALGDLAEAERYNALALDAMRDHTEHSSWPRLLANRAQILFQQDDLEGAGREAEAVLQRAESSGSRSSLGQALGLLAQVEQARGHVDAALTYVERALPLAEETGDPKELGELRLLEAHVLVDAGEPDRARALAESVLATARDADARLIERGALELLARIAESEADWEGALHHRSAHAELDRALTSAMTGRQMADLRASLALQQQNAELGLLQRDNQIQSLQIDRQRVFGLALFGGLLALSALILMVSMRYRYARRAHALLQSKSAALEQAARTDTLTGLANRFALSEALQQATAASGRLQALVLMDLDHFKQVNDSYGHPAGDLALRTAAQALHEHFDATITGRWGGEEFLAIVEERDRDALRQAADRCLAALRHTELRWEQHTFRITASLGIALRQPDEQAVSWLSRTDRALYAAKDAGRDGAVLADD